MGSQQTVKGDIAELKFAYEARRRGFNVNFPAGSDSEYDCIIESKGNIFRVQIKSTKTKEKDKNCYRINATYGSKRDKIYSKEVCDLIAVYVNDIDSFYLIPVEALASSTIRVYPDDPNFKDGYEQYQDNWKGL